MEKREPPRCRSNDLTAPFVLLRVLIVDDEPLACQRLRRILDDEPEVDVVAATSNGREAVKAVRAHSPDLVFLDVHMPEMDGFDFVRALPEARRPLIVFVTAHEKYAVPAFEAHAVDFLLKPFDRDRLQESLRRVRRRMQTGTRWKDLQGAASGGENIVASEERPDRIPIKRGGRIHFLKLDEIDWIGVADNYAELHVGQTAHLFLSTLTALESRLPPAQFARIGRSTIINVNRLKEVHLHRHGSCTVILEDGTQLALSRGHRHKLLRFFENR